MRTAFLLLLCFVIYASRLSAQVVSLSGVVKDSLTQLPLSGATISNSATKQKVQTTGNGFFRMMVSPNDLLYVMATGYRYDTLRYALLFQDTITLFLTPVNVLQAVTIETGYHKYQMDSLRRRREFEEARGKELSAIDRSKYKQTFGLTLNLDKLFKKKYKNQGKEEEILTSVEREAYVRFRFSPHLVSFYTGLKGDALLLFLRQYTPPYDWLRANTSREQLLDYLSEKLKLYRNSRR